MLSLNSMAASKCSASTTWVVKDKSLTCDAPLYIMVKCKVARIVPALSAVTLCCGE